MGRSKKHEPNEETLELMLNLIEEHKGLTKVDLSKLMYISRMTLHNLSRDETLLADGKTKFSEKFEEIMELNDDIITERLEDIVLNLLCTKQTLVTEITEKNNEGFIKETTKKQEKLPDIRAIRLYLTNNSAKYKKQETELVDKDGIIFYSGEGDLI